MSTTTTASITFDVSIASGKFSQRWAPQKWSFRELQEKLLIHDVRQNKDGVAFVPGRITGSRRNLTAMSAISMLVFDFDGEETLVDVDKRIESDIDYFCYLSTTHNHLATTSEVNTAHYAAWAKKAGREQSPRNEYDVQEYFAAKSKTLYKITRLYQDKKDTPEGFAWVVEHGPVEKFRVFFPLALPIEFGALGVITKAEACNVYESIYRGAADLLQLKCDMSCATAESLFYLPSCRAGATPVAYVYGDKSLPLLDWRSIPRKTKADSDKAKSDGKDKDRHVSVKDRKGELVYPRLWNENHRDFPMADVLAECAADLIHEPRPAGGYFIRCHAGAEHTSTGVQRTFVDNPRNDSPWTIKCSGNACDGRDPVDHLIELIRAGHVTRKDLKATEADDGAAGEFGVLSADGAGSKPNGDKAKPDADAKPSAAITATPYKWKDPGTIVPRDWVDGKRVRRYLSGTVAEGGLGKSSLLIVEMLSIATARPLLGGEAPRRGRVWYWCGEDDREELERRIQAACKHYEIGEKDLEGYLFVDSGREQPIVIVKQTRDGLQIAVPLREAMIKTICDNKIDLFIIDPFITSHAVSENDNTAIGEVINQWRRIAHEGNCAGELSHHVRKNGGFSGEATADSARGAAAFKDGLRYMGVLNRMTETESEKMGVVEGRRLHFRVDDGKTNMLQPAETATWYRLVNVDLGNATETSPKGDKIGVVTRFDPPAEDDGLPSDALQQVLRAFGDGAYKYDARASNWAGRKIAETLGLSLEIPFDAAQVKRLLKLWLQQGYLIKVEEYDPERRVPKEFIRVATSKEFKPIGPIEGAG